MTDTRLEALRRAEWAARLAYDEAERRFHEANKGSYGPIFFIRMRKEITKAKIEWLARVKERKEAYLLSEPYRPEPPK